MTRLVVPLLSLGIFDCAGKGIDWVRFNHLDDQVSVQVTKSVDLGEPVTEDLFSTTGSIVVGSVTVDPGSGPVGTLHTVLLDIDKDYKDVVRRATVTVDAGDRGSEAFEMTRDSADLGLWQLELESSGVPGEVRTDVFTIRLFQADDGTSTVDTGA